VLAGPLDEAVLGEFLDFVPAGALTDRLEGAVVVAVLGDVVVAGVEVGRGDLAGVVDQRVQEVNG